MNRKEGQCNFLPSLLSGNISVGRTTNSIINAVGNNEGFQDVETQNVGLGNRYCVGHLQSDIPCNNMIVFAVKILYILGWTWVLDLLCKRGYKKISWLLVLLPYITMFLLILLFILFSQKLN